jgi:hypothetical protein
MTLVNVRLEAADIRRVAELRRAGVRISAVVRQAIRAEHEQRLGKRSPDARSCAAASCVRPPDLGRPRRRDSTWP